MGLLVILMGFPCKTWTSSQIFKACNVVEKKRGFWKYLNQFWKCLNVVLLLL